MMNLNKLTSAPISLIFVLLLTFPLYSFHPANEPWTKQQLIEPSALAKILNNPKASQPVVFCTGIEAVIKNSIYIGPAGQKANLDKLKKAVEKLPKNTAIVIYCGCCPFDVCPNIRPAFKLLSDMGFTNHKLLNLSTNIKVDWIDHNYPVN